MAVDEYKLQILSTSSSEHGIQYVQKIYTKDSVPCIEQSSSSFIETVQCGILYA